MILVLSKSSKWPKYAKALDNALKPYFHVRHELSLQGDCVVRGTTRLLVPECLQPKFISLAHDTHQGIVRTKRRLRERRTPLIQSLHTSLGTGHPGANGTHSLLKDRFWSSIIMGSLKTLSLIGDHNLSPSYGRPFSLS